MFDKRDGSLCYFPIEKKGNVPTTFYEFFFTGTRE